jgi:hypothetical protein
VTTPADPAQPLKLWTYHPQAFQLNDPLQRVDSTKGKFWNSLDPCFRERYRRVLPRMQAIVGTDQFLWCCTSRKNGFEEHNHVELNLLAWEIEIRVADTLLLFRSPVWEDIVHGRTEDWDRLVISVINESQVLAGDVGGLVRFPPIEAKCIGRVPTYNEVRTERQAKRKQRMIPPSRQ